MRTYKQLFLAFVLLGFLLLNACTKKYSDMKDTKSTFYLIQPAEHFQAFNGHLTWYGKKRAMDLKLFLKDSGVQRIYLTAFSRAIETIDTLKNLQNIDTVQYAVDSVADNIFRLLQKRKDFGLKVLLVCPPGDFNAVIKKLGVTAPGVQAANKFNVMYEIINDRGKATLQKRTFGAPAKGIESKSKNRR